MKLAAIGLLITASSIASADIIKCSFTEPFVGATYSTTTNELKISEFDGEGEKVRTIRNVSFQIKGAGEFELLSKKGAKIMSLKITNEASDGMSNIIFPYEAKFEYSREGYLSGLVGGCSSNFLKADDSQEDPFIYASVAAHFPAQVFCIYIRKVSKETKSGDASS